MPEDVLNSDLSVNSLEEKDCINTILKCIRTSVNFEESEAIITQRILDCLKLDMAFIAEYDIESIDDINFKKELWAKKNDSTLSGNQKFVLQLKSFLKQMPKEMFLKQLAYSNHEDFFREILNISPQTVLSQDFWIKSFVATPILTDNELVGVLFVAQKEFYRQWSEKELSFLSKIADSLAIGMYQMRLYQRLKFFSDKQTLSNTIFEKIKSSIELSEVFSSTIELLAKFLNIPYAFISKHNLDTLKTEPISFEYQTDPNLKSLKGISININPNKHPMLKTIINENSYFASSCTKDLLIFTDTSTLNLQTDLNIQSLLIVPVVYSENSYASIWLLSSKELFWTENKINIVKEVSNQLTVAIHQYTLFKKLNEANQKLLLSYKKEQTIRKILETIRTTIDLASIYRDVTKEVGIRFKVNRTYFIEYNSDKKTFLDVNEEYLSDQNLYSFKNKPLPNVYINLLSKIIKNKNPYIVNNINEINVEAFQSEIGQQLDTKTAIFIPIYYQNNLLGVFVVSQTDSKRTWTNDEIEVLSIIANQVGLAIHQAKMYESLKEINRLKSDFLASFSHELKTPLNSILVLSEILQNKSSIKSEEERIELLKIIHLSGDELLRNINNILEIARLDTVNKKNSYINFSLKDLVNEVVPIIKTMANQKKINFFLQFDTTPNDYLYSDRKLIKLILSNLLNNAVKFTNDGFVQLILKKVDKNFVHSLQFHNLDSKNNKFLFIEVQDTGIGIDENYSAKIFEDFVQISSSETRTHAGTGLGLAICKRSVKLLGGEIWLESKLNLGSNFYAIIPL